MLKHACFPVLLLIAACKPPATDDYVDRAGAASDDAVASDPLPSPDTEGAVWAPSQTEGRIIYGLPGEAPLVALQCVEEDAAPARVRLTRFAPADPEAKAMAALIGNAHVGRIPVDAVWNGSVWLWVGDVAAEDERLETLTGRRAVELTIPGAGSVVLNPDARPARLIARCRDAAAPSPAADEQSPPAR